MHPTSRFGSKTAALVAVLLLAGTAAAQEAKPAAPAAVPQVHKMIISNGSTSTVSYSVEGGSPHLQALYQTLEFTENELSLTKELQNLRLGMVVNEQTADRLRTMQQLGLAPISTPGYAGYCAPPDSALKKALVPGLAREATLATAFELINLREKVQTELQAEQKKAVAPAPGVPPAKQNAPPVAPQGAGLVAAPQAVAQQLPMPLDPVAVSQSVRQNQAEVEWQGTWWAAQVVKTNGDRYYIHYTGWDNSWDEWVGPDRIRRPT
ncbi:MAG TPA: Tudor-knot domain-containing protein [Gemmataceae bacterium]